MCRVKPRASLLNRSRRGFSLIELMIVVAIILVIAIIAVPRMNIAMMYTHEMAAIQEIKTIHTAETLYRSQFGRYASNMQELGKAGLLPSSLSGGKKGGHVFAAIATPAGYAINVTPEHFGSDGSRTFYSDQTLELHENRTAEPATADSPVIGQPAAPSTAAQIVPSEAK